MSHKADALIITCMDFRLQRPELREFLEGLGLKTWDLRTQQGGAKDLLPAVQSDRKQSLLDAVRISMELHGFGHVGEWSVVGSLFDAAFRGVFSVSPPLGVR